MRCAREGDYPGEEMEEKSPSDELCPTRNFKTNRTFMNITPGTLIIGQLTISYIKLIIKTAYSSTWLIVFVMSRNIICLEVVGFGGTVFGKRSRSRLSGNDGLRCP